MSNKLLRRNEAAEYLKERGIPGCAPATLAKLASIGGGPNFSKFGKWPVYSVSDLDTWIAGRLTKPAASSAAHQAEAAA